LAQQRGRYAYQGLFEALIKVSLKEQELPKASRPIKAAVTRMAS